MKNFIDEKINFFSDTRLTHNFFNRYTVDVATDLLGKMLIFGEHRGIITETEAYRGSDDPASHAFRGLTPRTRGMFGAAGFSYVYLIYGMYHCLNVTTESEGTPGGVLIRGLLIDGQHLTGPGKICRYLGLNLEHNAINLIQSPNFYIINQGHTFSFKSTPRIGIKVGIDKLWRFIIQENEIAFLN